MTLKSFSYQTHSKRILCITISFSFLSFYETHTCCNVKEGVDEEPPIIPDYVCILLQLKNPISLPSKKIYIVTPNLSIYLYLKMNLWSVKTQIIKKKDLRVSNRTISIL